MRQVASLATEELAVRFTAYLITQGIDARVEAEGSGGVVWVLEENQVAAARQAYQDFQQDPQHERYQGVERAALSMQREEHRRREEGRRRQVNMSENWRSSSASTRRAPFTMLLIGACVLVTIWTNFGRDPVSWGRLSFSGPELSAEGGEHGTLTAISRGEFWRLFTPALVHLAWWHLLFNAMCAYAFGAQMEDRKGTRFMIQFVLVTAVVSNLSQALLHSPYFAGLSGVGYGMFGYVWMKSSFEPASGIRIDRFSVILFLVWFFLGLNDKWLSVAFVAHGAGLAVGVLWGYWPQFFRQK